jgi:hypothetical protein
MRTGLVAAFIVGFVLLVAGIGDVVNNTLAAAGFAAGRWWAGSDHQALFGFAWIAGGIVSLLIAAAVIAAVTSERR